MKTEKQTLIFDKAQITSRYNYSVPKWGGASHPLTSMCGEAIVIIKYENDNGRQSPQKFEGADPRK